MPIDKARKNDKKGKSRDGSSFALLPWVVIDSCAYMGLSHPARSLLVEFARQYVRDNNGRLLASAKHLSSRGWKSSDVIQRAKQELIRAGFIYETVKGHRPNKASWYAITWQDLDRISGYDAGVWEGWVFARSGYSKLTAQKIRSVNPSGGIDQSIIAPSGGVEKTSAALCGGAATSALIGSPIPSNGHHLEIPSAATGTTSI